MSDFIDVEFKAINTAYRYFLCDGCHRQDKVIKLSIPSTKYYDGVNLYTKYNVYWLCRRCKNKLIDALRYSDLEEE